MSFGEYLAGLGLSVVALGPIIWGAIRVRARLVPEWSGALAHLIDAVVALAITLATCQALGAFGAFRRAPVVAALAIVGLVLGIAAGDRRAARSPADGLRESAPIAGEHRDDRDATRHRRAATAIAVVAIAIVAGGWASRTAPAISTGTSNHDTLWYHLPHAARFYQEGSLTRLHFTDPDFPTAFHPSNAELMHGLGMVLFRREVLSPVLNLGWLALSLLAAWCLGRRENSGPAALVAASITLGAPLALLTFAGTANNDIPVVFFLVAALALLAHAGDRSVVLAAAGLAAGMALSTKLTAIVPVVVMTVAVVVMWRRSGWRLLMSVWFAPLLATGSYWYIRNLARVDSPIPGLPLGAGPLPFPSPRFRIVDEFGYSVADYAREISIWRRWFVPGLRLDFGWLWWVTLALAAAGAILVFVSRGDRGLRLAGLVAAVGVVTYAVTPTTALGPKGSPLLFASNVRYAIPALTIAVVVLPLLPVVRDRRRRTALLAVFLAVLVVSQVTGGSGCWGSRATIGLATMVAVAALGAAIVAARDRWSRQRGGSVVAIAVIVVAVAAFPMARAHVRDEFRTDPLWRWARDLSGARIALAGSERQYPLYGVRLDNFVQYIGRRGPDGEFTPAPDCRFWRRSLRAGRYGYVFLKPGRLTSDVLNREVPWTESDPAATLLLTVGNAKVFRFDPTVSDPGCA